MKGDESRVGAPRKRDWSAHPVFQEERDAERRRRQTEPIRRMESVYRRRSALIQLGCFALVFLLWRLPVANPIKLLVVLFHELSHVAAAYLTGGVVFGIAIDPGAAGATLGFLGNETIIVAAGYVGSLSIGMALYFLSAKWDPKELWLALCGVTCVSLLFGWLNDFTAAFGWIAIVLMGVGHFVLGNGIKTFIVRLVATTSCLYPILDVAGEWLSADVDGFRLRGEIIGSDLRQLSVLTGWPEGVIGIVWIIAGFLAVAWLARWTARQDAASEVRRRFFRPRLPGRNYRDPIYIPNDPNSSPEYVVK